MNITKDEELNDYIYIWGLFQKKPSKLNFYTQFDGFMFWRMLETHYGIKPSNVNRISDIFIVQVDVIANTKCLVKLDNNSYISFYEVGDKLNDKKSSPIVTNFTLYYDDNNISLIDVENILAKFQEAIIHSSEEKESFINVLSYSYNNSGFELSPTKIKTKETVKDYLYSSKENVTSTEKIIKQINTSFKNLNILCGERGSGKTTQLLYILEKIKKKSIYMPISIFETAFNSNDFFSFLSSLQGSCLIIDDCEDYYTENINPVIYGKNITYTKVILQYLDGILSDNLDLNIVLSMNIEQSKIDATLLQCANIVNEFKKLDTKQANELAKKLKTKNVFKQPTLIRDIVKFPQKNIIKNIGY